MADCSDAKESHQPSGLHQKTVSSTYSGMQFTHCTLTQPHVRYLISRRTISFDQGKDSGAVYRAEEDLAVAVCLTTYKDIMVIQANCSFYILPTRLRCSCARKVARGAATEHATTRWMNGIQSCRWHRAWRPHLCALMRTILLSGLLALPTRQTR